ncbi:MAG: ribonuclease HII [Candidatus Eiseniibacteriota bacterium]|nr:MAG: ribonuclease HII [Candidatus Eisenbacteria bacterium]
MRPNWQERFLELKENERTYVDEAGGFLAGVDEAGRGPLAGPVVAAAVVLPNDFIVERVDDSKRLTPLRREKLHGQICDGAASVSWVSLSERVVDEAGILNATYIAMREAIAALSVTPGLVLVDGREIPGLDTPQAAFPRADSRFLSVACASVVAKCVRDALMAEAHLAYPQYGFDAHKGYGTRRHIEALLRYGPCRIHRFSFRPVREIEKGSSGRPLHQRLK